MQKPQFLGEKVCVKIRVASHSLSGPQDHVVESLTLMVMSIAGKVYRIQNPEHGR